MTSMPEQNGSVLISVAISTFNRPEKVSRLVSSLLAQTMASDLYELIVVDNGSAKPVSLPDEAGSRRCRLLRFDQNQERSRSRSTAVAASTGEYILFLDDDLIVRPDLLEVHLQAQREWPGVMAIGRIILPPSRLGEPGIRFRQNLELQGIPERRGLVTAPNFGTAANVSMRRDHYLRLGGFDPAMDGIEDQDFAMRHTAGGGTIAFLPEAVVIHDDEWLDFFSFCQRQERGMEWTVAFSRRYPAFKDSVDRDLVNGPIRPRVDPVLISAKKSLKAVLGTPPGEALLRGFVAVLERTMPDSQLLRRAYELTLGVYLRRGYLRGIRRFREKRSGHPSPEGER